MRRQKEVEMKRSSARFPNARYGISTGMRRSTDLHYKDMNEYYKVCSSIASHDKSKSIPIYPDRSSIPIPSLTISFLSPFILLYPLLTWLTDTPPRHNTPLLLYMAPTDPFDGIPTHSLHP